MRKILLFVLILITIQINAQDKTMEIIKKNISEIQGKYAPDKRVAIFKIELKEVDSLFQLVGETTDLEAKNALLKVLELANIKIDDKIKLLPENDLGIKTFGLIDVSVANLRGEPKHPAEMVTQALLGTPVHVLKYYDGFYLIQTPDKYIAWVDEDAVETISKAEYDNWYNSDKVIFTNDFGFSYTEANVKSERISDLVLGNILVKIGEQDEFTKVKYPDGREAFVAKSGLKDFNECLLNVYPTREKIIETAKLFIGNPYLWGGTSAKGLDCSGFTKTVYFLNGVILDRDASQQVKKGIKVDTENNFNKVQKGDLLFFGVKSKDGLKRRITHVGIYIDNLEFIHEAGKVKYNSFDKNAKNFSKYRLNNFAESKNIIDSIGKNGIELIKDNKFYNGELKWNRIEETLL